MPISRNQGLLAAALVTAAMAGAGGTLLLTNDDPTGAVASSSVTSPASTAPTAPPSRPQPPSPSPSLSDVAAPASASPAPPPAPVVVQLDEEALESAPVPSLCGHPAGRLRDGKLPGIPRSAGDVEAVETALVDLDADGLLEGVLMISCSAGNSPSTSVHVYRSGPRLIGEVPIEAGLGSEARVTDIAARRGRVEVSARFQDEQDARCCPSGYVVRSFQLKSGQLKPVAAAGVDRTARVTGDGWGNIRVGESYEQLARATGLPVDVDVIEETTNDYDAEPCTYVSLGGNDSVLVMGGEGRARAVVFSSPGAKSKSGAGVGSTEDQVLAAYGDRASRVPNTYGPIADVVVSAGNGRIVRFEFNEARVVQTMHAGETEYASLVEGCA